MTYKITNQQLFDSKLDDVNLADLRGGRNWRGEESITGDVTLVFGNNQSKNYSGEFASKDFEEEYGFVLVIPDNQ